jgi:hypothetical protein
MLERTGEVEEAEVNRVLGEFTRPWAWRDA